MKQITIKPNNPNVVKPEDAEELANAIKNLHPDYDVNVLSKELLGTGVTLWEVVEIAIVSELTRGLVKHIIKLATNWARERFKKQGVYASPKYFRIYGPNDKPLKAFVLKTPDSKPEDLTKDLLETEQIRAKYLNKSTPKKQTFCQKLINNTSDFVSRLTHSLTQPFRK